MSLLTLAITLGFVVVAILLSAWQKLGLEKEMVVSTVRATAQLLIVGYILKAVFSFQDPLFTALMIALMIGVATQNAKQRGAGISRIGWRVLAAIALAEAVTLGFLLVFRIVPPEPRYTIPISGMVIGNSMVIASLLLNRLRAEVKSRRQEILLILSLGGTPKQSIRHVLKEAIRASMIPTVDSMKTTGLVQLPGMMTGQIIAGADPIQAVRYQLLILFAILAAAALTSVVLGFLTSPAFFNQYQQLAADEEDE